MDRFDSGDTHLVFEGISDGIDNKFGLESVFYGMGFLAYLVVITLFIDLFFTSITSPILYSTFAPIRRRRRRRRSASEAQDQMEPEPSFPVFPTITSLLHLLSPAINQLSQNNNVTRANRDELGDAVFPRILIIIDQLTDLLED